MLEILKTYYYNLDTKYEKFRIFFVDSILPKIKPSNH